MASPPLGPRKVGSLSLDRAAFLLIRIKRIFRKKRSNKCQFPEAGVKGGSRKHAGSGRRHPPLLRARTLPAIITPSLNILQAQLDPKQTDEGGLQFTSSVQTTPPLERHQSFEPSKWKLMVDDISPSSKSPTASPRHSVSSTSSTSSYYSQAGSSSFFKNKSETTTPKLSKLARLLTPKERSTPPEKNGHLSPAPEVSCFSWSSPSSGALRRAGSIDSLMDSTGAEDSPDNGGCITLAVPSVHRQMLLPLSPSMPSKLAKDSSSQGGTTKQDSIDSDKKKVDKTINDLQALLVAVESRNLPRAAEILETADFDINTANGDGLTALDLAVLTGQIQLVKLLQSYGATESCRGDKGTHLHNLLAEAERSVADFSSCLQAPLSTNGSLSAALLKEKERQLLMWQRRLRLLQQMAAGYNQIRIPDTPSNVQLEVTSHRSLKVKFLPPKSASKPESLVLKYKVEWSRHERFEAECGLLEVPNNGQNSIVLPDLEHGVAYSVRISAGNAKGWGSWRVTRPSRLAPSSWRDLEETPDRAVGRLEALDRLFVRVLQARPHSAAEVKYQSADTSETPQQQRRQMRKSIKNLFTSAPKFQKTMKRGVYLACLLYSEDKVLVTTEDMLPILEVDETYPSSIHTDFHWLMKVACTWEDVKTLRRDMEKSHSSSSVHFRGKILQAVEQMQNALGIQDLGQLYHRPLKDAEGTLAICAVRSVADPKSLVTLSVRWASLAKLQRKLSSAGAEDTGGSTAVSDLLLTLLKDMISYHQVSCKPLPRGLYLGYVKLKSSVDLIRVLVPVAQPNMLPHTRVRENPHVSKEEWVWLRDREQQGELQLRFQHAVGAAAKTLLARLEVGDAAAHRLYDGEVIELSSDVSFLLVLPAAETVCSVPGELDGLSSRPDLVPLPVQVFEMIHMATYHPSFITLYSRLSSILEMDTLVAQHANREAFSANEVAQARSRLTELQEFQSQAENTWRGMRWIMDVISFARERQAQGAPLWYGGTPPSPPPIASPRKPRRHRRQHLITSASSQSISSERSPVDIRRSSSTSRLDLPQVVTDHRTPDSSTLLKLYTETGLSFAGGHLQFHVGPETTTREVLEAAALQLCPPHCPQDLNLVALLGAKERRLDDDFHPASLVQSWTKSQIFVRKSC